MDICKAYRNKTVKIQCSARIKTGFFCGKHQSTPVPIFDMNGNLIMAGSDNGNCGDGDDCRDNIKKIIQNNDKVSIYKKIAASDVYNQFLDCRKVYMKDAGYGANKPILLIEYLENSKMDFYPYSRILASLEYYKLLNANEIGNSSSKFLLVSDNVARLESLFTILLKANTHLDKLVRLQRWIRKSLLSFSKRLHGPDRALAVNDSDFVSLDDIKDISDDDFIGLEDGQGFVYGFNLDSAVDLILKMDENYLESFKKNHPGGRGLCYRQFVRVLYNHYNKIKINNPYTRDLLPSEFKLRIFQLYARKIYKSASDSQNLAQSNTGLASAVSMGAGAVDFRQQVRNKCFAIFQKIDMFGYMTDITWFIEENVKTLKAFYKKLALQWNLEFGLNNTARYRIAQNHNLFSNSHLQDIMLSRAEKFVLLDKILDTMNILVSNGETEADRNTGSIMILYALASVNRRWVEANPWLS